MKQLKK